MRDIWGITILLFLTISLKSQINVLGGFAKDTIVIGDSVELRLSLEVSEGVEVIGVASYFLDSIYSALESVKAYTDTTQPMIPRIADFELLSNGGWNDNNDDKIFTQDELEWDRSSAGGKNLLERAFQLRLWDPGENIALYPVVIYQQNGAIDEVRIEEQMKVFVAPPGGLPAVQDSLSVAPIKNIKEEAVNFSDYLIYFLVIGIALVLGLLYWWYSKYYKDKMQQVVVQETPEVYVPPHVIAQQKLRDLRSKELWQKGEIKEYQSELTHIIREYLEGRYDIAALESTTDEIVKSLVMELTNDNDVISLKRILQVADLVKFAKAQPELNLHESFMTEAEEFVIRTKQIEETEPDD